MEIEITEKNFEDEVIKSNIPVLIDFWATWCGPCKMIAPEIENIASSFDGKIKVGKINVDEQMNLAMKYNVEFIPTLILFKNGNVEKRESGYFSKDEIISKFGLDKI